MLKFLKNEQEITRLNERVVELECEIGIIKCRFEELQYKYLENLRTLRFSQKANCRYKRSIKKFRAAFRQQEEPKRIDLKTVKRRKLPI